MYESFEKGVCDKLSLDQKTITKEARHMLKLAYLEANGLPTQPPPQKKGIPWKTLAGLGLAGAGGAYAYGRMNPNSALSGFSGMLDRNVVNPVWNAFHKSQNPVPTSNDEAFKENSNSALSLDNPAPRVNLNMSGVSPHNFVEYKKPQMVLPSGITSTYENKLNNQLQQSENDDALALYGNQKNDFFSRHDDAFGRAGLSSLGADFLGASSKFTGPLASIATAPTWSELADKASDTYGITNDTGRKIMQAAYQTVNVGAAGARFVPGLSAAATAMETAAPTLNQLGNTYTAARNHNYMNSFSTVDQNNAFIDALNASKRGNGLPLNTWYNHFGPQGVNAILNETKLKAVRDRIVQNSPFPLPSAGRFNQQFLTPEDKTPQLGWSDLFNSNSK